MKNSFILFSCLFFLVACKDNDDETFCPETPSAQSNAYFPLTIGNYWVHEYRLHDLDGTISGNGHSDSLKVEGDTLINGYDYFILTTNKPAPDTRWFVRDSLGYIVSSRGSMVLPPDPRQDLYNRHYGFLESDTIYDYFDQFPEINIVSTNFGAELCLLQEATHIGFSPLPELTLVDSSYYGSFGPVQRSFSYSAGPKLVGTLIDYHLEEE